MIFSPKAFLVAAFLLVVGTSVLGQEPGLQLIGFSPAGGRTTLTNSWGILKITVANTSETSKDARVVVFYADDPSIQYARDVWVPAQSRIESWLPIGPAPRQSYPRGCELHALLIDRTAGEETIILPSTDERVRTSLARYRPRSPTTVLIVDLPVGPDASKARTTLSEVEKLVRTARAKAGLPEDLTVVGPGPMSTHPESFAGIDQIVLASNQLAADAAGCRAMREWVHRGGRLWILLDHVTQETVSQLLDQDLPFHVVDRVGLTTLNLHSANRLAYAAGLEFERPVDLVRVVLSPSDRLVAVANGWPAAFSRSLGRGHVLFTTLGARGWTTARASNVPVRIPNPKQRMTPPSESLGVESIIGEFGARVDPSVPLEVPLQDLVVDEIGYSIIGREWAGVILGSFVVGLTLIGFGLRRSRRPELVGWLAPGLAMLTAGIFVFLAMTARRAVPPTVATAGIADAVAASDDLVVNGIFAVYQPESGPVPFAAERGGQFDLDFAGLEGQTRRRIQTDTDTWYWDGLSVPAGVRTGRFQLNLKAEPVTAIARFGPEGIEGRLKASVFKEFSDAILTTATRVPLSLQMKADGSFSGGIGDELPPSRYIAGAVLSDRQQRRQVVYQELLGESLPQHMERRDIFLCWSERTESSLTSGPATRRIDTTLLVVPVTFEPPVPGSRIKIPRTFVPY